ncbi:MAG TPA: condensation domain-containing protein, partial [Thermoanaerobaculia bacterium]
MQAIRPALELPLPVVDLSALPTAARAAEEHRLVLLHSSPSFDLAVGPLVAALLVRLAPEDHRLAVVIHHIVSDGWSLGVFQAELAQHYRRFLLGGPEPPALPLQYVDFAAWQRQELAGEKLEKLLGYWRPQLAGLPILDLRGDRPRPPVQTFPGAYEDFRLSRERTTALTELAQRQGGSLFMALLSGFSVLLGRYSGQDDFAVGAYIANRTRAELEGMIGFFVNNLALRADLSGAPTATGLLGRVRETTVGAYAHQELPFEKLIAELQPERDLSRAPLVQAMLNFLNFPAVHEELPGLTLQGAGVRNERASFDVTLWVSESPDGLVGWLDYNTDLFDGATIRRMVGHFDRLLAGLVAESERWVAELPLLSASEQAEIAALSVRRDAVPAVRVEQRIEAQVAATPEATAIRFADERLTYHELNARANQLARWLVRQGLAPEAPIGLALERSPSLIVSVLAVLKAGGAYVPLDPSHPRERLAKILEDAQPALVLSETALSGDLPETAARIVRLDDRELRAAFAAEAETDLALGLDPDNLAYVLFTSGSTGRPKGVQVSHRALVNFLASMAQEPGLTADDAILAITTLSFDIAGLELLLPLTVG